MLVICDDEKPVALAGVMGGANSEINHKTTNVLIESAYFNPASIRKTAKKLSYHTEASHRFEKGTDPEGVLFAAERAAMLIQQTGGGIIYKGVVDNYPEKWQPKTISVSSDRVNRILGTDIETKEMVGFLKSIELDTSLNGNEITVTSPSFRVDLERPEDLVEEISRLWGFDRIPVTSPKMALVSPSSDPYREFWAKMKLLLSGMGFSEAITYSFDSDKSPDLLELPEDDPARKMVSLQNPLTEAQNVMRTSLVPGLLEVCARNINMGRKDLSFFELGKIFLRQDNEELPFEKEMACVLLSGTMDSNDWRTKKPRKCDFFDLKDVFEGLSKKFRVFDAVFEKLPENAPYLFVPGQAASISVKGREIGKTGCIRPSILKKWEVKQPVFMLEIDINAFYESCNADIQYAPIPRYPSLSRDVTLIVNTDVQAGDILVAVDNADEPYIESRYILDSYEGKPIEEGKKSLSFRIVYRSHEKTLTDEFINEQHEKIGKKLIREFNALLP